MIKASAKKPEEDLRPEYDLSKLKGGVRGKYHRQTVAGPARHMEGTIMPERKRVCFLLHVKEDRLAEYKERHKSVWPEMRQALRETGWHNYSLYLTDDGLLIGYVETPDFQKALSGMAAQEVNARWQAQMKEFFEDPGGREADKQMAPLEEVFHLD